jgi:enoyl-CoA hydratase
MNQYPEASGLRISLDGNILRLAFSASPGNAVSPEAHRALGIIFREVARDDRVRLVLLTGEGDFAFSLGGDVRSMQAMLADRGRWIGSMGEARDLVMSMLECDKPVIGRINGHAIGLGATLALCCDITCMVDDAKIGDPHVKVGLAAGDGGALLWPALVGLSRAKRALLTGDPIKGSQAAAIGLVTEAVSRAELDTRIAWWIDHLTKVPRLAQRLTKRALHIDLLSRLAASLDSLLGLETLSYLADEHRECVEQALAREEQ